MLFNKVPLIDGLEIDQAHKGGGKGAPPPPPPQIAPTPPVEEASVQIEEDKNKGKTFRSSKEKLKIPGFAGRAISGLNASNPDGTSYTNLKA